MTEIETVQISGKKLKALVKPLLEEGMGYIAIAERLNGDGFRTSKGNRFNDGGLGSMLRSVGLRKRKRYKHSVTKAGGGPAPKQKPGSVQLSTIRQLLALDLPEAAILGLIKKILA